MSKAEENRKKYLAETNDLKQQLNSLNDELANKEDELQVKIADLEE